MKFTAVMIVSSLFVLPLAAAAEVVSLPPPSNAVIPGGSAQSSSYQQQVATLQAEVQALTLLLTQLLQQKATGVSSGGCSAITGPLGPGDSGAAVLQLQTLLASQGFFQHAPTGYYGSVTTAAVQQFQSKHGIASSGTPATTGYGRVGPKTLAAIQAQCDLAGSTVGAFIQVSPDSGPAPLQVTVQATVNTMSSCSASTYVIDFGDNSGQQNINVAPGTCASAQQTYSHTYGPRGSYAVTISSGQSSNSATVVVQ